MTKNGLSPNSLIMLLSLQISILVAQILVSTLALVFTAMTASFVTARLALKEKTVKVCSHRILTRGKTKRHFLEGVDCVEASVSFYKANYGINFNIF